MQHVKEQALRDYRLETCVEHVPHGYMRRVLTLRLLSGLYDMLVLG